MAAPCYALYKGDEFVDLGSIRYLAKELGIKERSVIYYMSPAYQRKLGGDAKGSHYILIRIEDDEKEEQAKCQNARNAAAS